MAISYVGGKTHTWADTATAQNISLTDLTGGSDTAPSANDLVVIFFGTGAALTDISITTSGYTEAVTDPSGNDTYDCRLSVSYKVMGGTPDTSFTTSTTAGSGDVAHAVVVMVFRGVHTATPMDVSGVTASNINTALANAPSITPSTAGSWVLAGGVAGHLRGSGTFSSSDLSPFLTVFSNGSANDLTIGAGYYSSWTSGAFDPAAFTFSAADNTAFSWAAATLAVRSGVLEGAGSASGAGTATASGNALILADGAASGAGSATGIGAATSAAAGSAAGVGSATSVGARTAASVGSAAGTGTASATGTSIRAGDGAATGAGTATATGVSLYTVAPTSDISDGTWTDQAGGTSLFAAIDEATASDADYIKSANLESGQSDICEVLLGNMTAPTVDANHSIAYRYRAQGDATMNLIVALRQGGATQIASVTHSGVGSTYVNGELVLSEIEAGNITDYSDLRLRFTAEAA